MTEPSLPIDLRSDTVTRPSPAMRRAMADAPVGDDQYGEDPTVNRLQERIADLLGKEAALFVPSGTMANQIALKILTRPGDEVLVGEQAHIMWHEAGAGAANSGVLFTEIGSGGLFTAADLRAAVKPRGHIVLPATALVAIENTHNLGSGIVFPQADVTDICTAAHAAGLATYLDGARLFNASVASGLSLAELAASVRPRLDRIVEGAGLPGRQRAGGRQSSDRRGDDAAPPLWRRDAAVRYPRRRWPLCARPSCLRPRDRPRQRPAHRRAPRPVAGGYGRSRTVQTNIVIFHMAPDAPDAATIVQRAKAAGVLISALGPRIGRAVTHRDVTAAQCRQAADLLAAAIENG